MDFFRDILMAAATQAGGAAAADPYGPELVTNGNMSSGTGWSLEGDVPPVIAAGKLTAASAPDSATARQTPTLTAATYHTVFTIDSITDGSAVVTVGFDGNGTSRTTAGTFTQDIACSGDDNVDIIMTTDGTIVIDNFSVKQVL